MNTLPHPLSYLWPPRVMWTARYMSGMCVLTCACGRVRCQLPGPQLGPQPSSLPPRPHRLATERSNKQVLTPLGWLDIGVVALVSGFSEELLFRGAIMPATFLDWWV